MRNLLLSLACLLPIQLVAQTELTIHVGCKAWGITDDKWTIQVTVNDGVDDHTVKVHSFRHADSSQMAAAIRMHLNRKLGRRAWPVRPVGSVARVQAQPSEAVTRE